MKKYITLCLSLIILLTGCGKYSKNDAMKDFSKTVSKAKSYNLEGTMEILNNDEIFKYYVDVYYKKDGYYKVDLVNQINNHEQIILKNKEGVYVITPSLNKSFKFQSQWPQGSSQVYILESLLDDLENDNDKKFIKEKDKYIFKCAVNYPNNRNLKKERITFDKKMNLKKVEVLDENGTVIIKFNVTSYDRNNRIKSSVFDIKNNVKTEKEETTSKEIDEIIYPMYLPKGTSLKSEEKVNTEDSSRVILNFDGDKPFTLIEESVSANDDLEIIPVYGELTFASGNIGNLTGTSLSWNDENKDYYLVGENLSSEELVSIASSIGVVAINK